MTMNEEKKNETAVAANEDANFLEGASNNNSTPNEEADVSSVENSKYKYIRKIPFNQRQYGVAYDGLDWFPDYITPVGKYDNISFDTSDLPMIGYEKVGIYMQKFLPNLLFKIVLALRKIEYLRGTYQYVSLYGNAGHVLVRLRHINNTYPEHYFAVNIPEKQAEILICFDNDADKQEFIGNQYTYFGGKTLEEAVRTAEKDLKGDVDNEIETDNDINSAIKFYISLFTKINASKPIFSRNPDETEPLEDNPLYVHLYIALCEMINSRMFSVLWVILYLANRVLRKGEADSIHPIIQEFGKFLIYKEEIDDDDNY